MQEFESFQAKITRAANLLRNARRVVVFTGAGISTPSGIPDFRSARTGLWEKDDPMQVASLTAFRYHPQRFFDWLHPLAASMWNAEPNPAHQALAALQKAGLVQTIITQNIDGLHQAAGSIDVIELHGSMNTLTCPKCSKQYAGRRFLASFVADKSLPHCPSDGQLLKPDIVLFEEMLPEDAWSQAELACEEANLVVVVGSSLEVWPAGQLPFTAFDHGAKIIINNLTPTGLDAQAEVLLPYDVTEAIPAIARELNAG
jgi:NAD-dependent deacetylase